MVSVVHGSYLKVPRAKGSREAALFSINFIATNG